MELQIEEDIVPTTDERFEHCRSGSDKQFQSNLEPVAGAFQFPNEPHR